jgi:lipopolysaccharide transport system ATP-binding protein
MLEVGTGFNGEMTGRENVYMNGAILGMTKAEIDAKMEDIIEFSEVREFIDTPVKRYSSGMYVKLAFSVAAHLDSEIMIMDEVLAVGDMAFQKKCLTKMREAATQEGRTVLYVSHNMNTIRQLCDRCIVLDQGKIVFDGDVEEAIEVYSNTHGRIQTEYTYSKDQRPRKRGDGSFEICSLSISEGGLPVCQYGGEISFDLLCHSSRALKDVFFRFEIQYHDETITGTMLSASGVSFSKNEQKLIKMTMDTEHIAPGRYKMDIIAYQFNSFGQEQFLDGVYPGLIFEIEDTINNKNKLIWLHKFWGHVRLKDVLLSE